MVAEASNTDELRIRAYVEEVTKNGLQNSITNVECEIEILSLHDFQIPIVRCDGINKQSYVTSQVAHYVSCAEEEALRELPRLASKLVSLVLTAMRYILEWSKIDRVVYVNNLLVSTNLYPPNFDRNLPELHGKIKATANDRAIIFRSVNPTFDPEIFKSLQELGYKLIPSRKTYFIDATNPKIFRIKNFRHDLRLIEQQSYRLIPVGPNQYEDYERLSELYRMLYTEKYSEFNPKYNDKYIRAVVESGFCTVLALVKNGRADGFLGYYKRGNVITTPLFGYDTSIDRSVGLYRMISATSLLEAKQKQCVSHESSGAAKFKRLRGATSGYEYTAVYLEHLSLRTKISWWFINRLTRLIAVPLIDLMGL